MNILIHLPRARKRLGGGDLSLLRLGTLLGRDHTVRVRHEGDKRRTAMGFQSRPRSPGDLEWADVMLTAAGETTVAATHAARTVGLPVVAFVHSAATESYSLHPETHADLIVWGSAALERRTREKMSVPADSIVLWPPIDADGVRANQAGDAITMVNLMPEKGGRLFWSVCERLPDVPFMGVRGGWGKKRQIVPKPLPRNASVMNHVRAVRKVYARTRVLLYMRGPDTGPDWLNGVGLTALEASVNGIPTIAHPGAGLKESLGAAGTWVDSDDPDDWAAAIRRMLEPEVYAERSQAARERAAEVIAPERDAARLMDAVAGLSMAGVA